MREQNKRLRQGAGTARRRIIEQDVTSRAHINCAYGSCGLTSTFASNLCLCVDFSLVLIFRGLLCFCRESSSPYRWHPSSLRRSQSQAEGSPTSQTSQSQDQPRRASDGSQIKNEYANDDESENEKNPKPSFVTRSFPSHPPTPPRSPRASPSQPVIENTSAGLSTSYSSSSYPKSFSAIRRHKDRRVQASLDAAQIGGILQFGARLDLQHSPSPNLGDHGSRCHPVIIKVSPDGHMNSRLQYELVIHEKLFFGTTRNQGSPLSREETVRITNSSIDRVAHLTERRISPERITPPHLRKLEDGRCVLVIDDTGGNTLLQIIKKMNHPHLIRPYSSSTPSSGSSSTASQWRVLHTATTSDNSAPSTPSSLSSFSSQSIALCNASLFSSVSSPLTDVNDLVECLRMILAVTSRLQLLHELSLIHRSLAPSTILINPANMVVSFLDFSTASLLLKNRCEPIEFNPQSKSNQWLFAAPEMSGRANRLIDARSDLYSIGAILYHLLTGEPPFYSDDVLEVIHAHLAKAPPSIKLITQTRSNKSSRTIMQAAVNVVDQIVQKLLKKNPEDRYQCTAGLIHDFTATIRILTDISVTSQDETRKRLETFQIGQLDLHSTFRISQCLYGRQAEVDKLIHLYPQIGLTAIPRLALISGYSGIG